MSFDKETFSSARNTTATIWDQDQIVSSMKAHMKAGEVIDFPSERDLKLEILRTLHDRQSLYVMDAQNDDKPLEEVTLSLLKTEQRCVKSEAKMRIVHIHGDPDAYAPYQYLATTIAEIICKKGNCSKSDIIKVGSFSEKELQNWNMAYALAQIDLMEA